MRELVGGFISHSLSRRKFVQSLAALGVSATGIASTIEAAEAVTGGGQGPGQPLTGAGGEPGRRGLYRLRRALAITGCM